MKKLPDIEHLFSDPDSTLFSVGFDKASRRYAPRDAQVRFALKASECFAAASSDMPSVGLLQGDTGIGKALGYLIPAMLHGVKQKRRVVISTFTIELQRQILKETIPTALRVVHAETGTHLKYARRIGKGNFISIEAFQTQTAALDGSVDPEMMKLLRKIGRRLAEDPDDATRQMVETEYGIDLIELGGLPFSYDSVAIGQYPRDDRGYVKMIEEAEEADVLVINHALLVSDLISYGRVLHRDQDRREDLLIVDEADQLPEVAESMKHRKVPFVQLRSIGRVLSEIESQHARPYGGAFKKLEKLTRCCSGSPIEAPTGKAAIYPLHADNREEAASFAKVLTIMARAVSSELDEERKIPPSAQVDLKSVQADLKAIVPCLDRAQREGRPNELAGLYWTPVRGLPGLYMTGGQASHIIQRLWSDRQPRPAAIAFVSATLASAEKPGEAPSMHGFRTRTGLVFPGAPKVTVLATEAPERFGAMEFVLVDVDKAPNISVKKRGDPGDEDIEVRTNPQAFKWWAGMVIQAAGRGGRVLALTLSYKDAERLGHELRDSGLEIIVHGPGDRSAVERFKASKNSVLISAGLWAGLDLPGMIRHVVVTRLPIAPMDTVGNAFLESLIERQQKAAGKKGGLSAKDIMSLRFPALIERARRQFRQGIGRGIRRHTDRVTVWIGDRRFSVPAGRPHRFVQPTWSKSFKDAVPQRFRPALERAEVFTLDGGAKPFERPKNKMFKRKG